MAEATGDAQGYRYERKFVSSGFEAHAIETFLRLHPAFFREIYRERFVNNIYLDTPSLENYEANIRGIAKRVKCRIRWYGDLFGTIAKPVLELKRKQGLLGRKDAHPLPGFSLDSKFRAEELFASAELPESLGVYLSTLRPALVNRYRRRYYLSANGRYRITVDWGLEFHRVDSILRGFPTPPTRDPRTIIELKFDRGEEADAARITQHIPFRLSRSSKYVSGIEALFAW